MIIVLEGIDASGKATQAKKLTSALGAHTFDFPRYQSRTGQAILGLLTGKWGIKTSAIEQVFQIDVGDIPPEKVSEWIEAVRRGLDHYSVTSHLIPPDKVEVRVTETERAAHEAETRALVLQSLMTTNRLEVFPMLCEHWRDPAKHLVLDRYFTSGLVYGQADGLPLDYLFDIHKSLPPADLWVFIDIPPEESRKRRPERRDEYERRAGFMEKVALGYMELFRVAIPGKPAGKWVVVDGLGTADEVHERIMSEVRSIL